jgi:hypothetical protein
MEPFTENIDWGALRNIVLGTHRHTIIGDKVTVMSLPRVLFFCDKKNGFDDL